MSTSIWWIRRDLRLHDNPALAHALCHGEKVIPLFILDPYLLSEPPCNRDRFLFSALRALEDGLLLAGSRLVVRHGPPLDVLMQLQAESGADLIVSEADHSPYALSRDREIGNHLPLDVITGLTVHPPQAVRKADGTPYTIFTPFSRAWKALPLPGAPLPSPKGLPPVSDTISSEAIPAGSFPYDLPANEASARDRLSSFLDAGVFHYADRRDMLGADGTSRLSPYFKFGLLSLREAVYRIRQAIAAAENNMERESAVTWLNELIWREFYISILAHFPSVARQSFRENLSGIHWADDPRGLRAWQDGLTGYPLVDAAMRQLRTTGWMHNRARMITASFLTKDLLIDWREGEHWFMQHLIDGDLASNNGGWQWTAGTGTDAAPYFRIFNPILQSRKFDPNGEYIRRWVPELAHLDRKHIHAPWEHSDLRSDYPPPIADHRIARERTLAAYKTAKARWENQSR